MGEGTREELWINTVSLDKVESPAVGVRPQAGDTAQTELGHWAGVPGHRVLLINFP